MLSATSWREDGLPKRTFSVMMIVLLFLSVITLVFNVQLVEADVPTVYINADGSVTPSSAPIHTSDNITYVFTGNVSYPNYYGVDVARSNIVIDGNGYTMQGNQSGGLSLTNVNNVTIISTNVENFAIGIFLYSSSNNTISGNNVTNSFDGIMLSGSSDNTISGNNIAAYSSGIMLWSGSNNESIIGNNIAHSTYGVFLIFSSNNIISGNEITANSVDGIWLSDSCNYNSIDGNDVKANNEGIYLDSFSNDNSISGNNITASNTRGIELSLSSSNKIYHNNFINNTSQASSDDKWSGNVWDDGYPSGGNYWSDYQTRYPNVAEIDSSGIWNTPYVIYANNTDQYPFVQPYVPSPETGHDVAVVDVTPYGNWTYQGWPINISVTTTNFGIFTENETLSIFYTGSVGAGMIGSETVALAPNETETLTFIWNTTSISICYSGYTITAFANISPEIDSNVTNNVLQSALNIEVRILGDINGDGKVDGRDVTMAAKAFGTRPGDPRWNPDADINQDGRVDGRDITLIARNFGK